MNASAGPKMMRGGRCAGKYPFRTIKRRWLAEVPDKISREQDLKCPSPSRLHILLAIKI